MGKKNSIDISFGLKDKASAGLKKITAGIKSVSVGIAAGTAAAAAFGLGLVAAAVKAVSSFSKLAGQTNKLSAQLGISRDDAGKLGVAVEKAFIDGFGSIEAASAAVAAAFQQFGDVGADELAGIATRARELSVAFGGEVPEKLAAVDTLMRNFGITSDQAFDLVTKGYQDGLNGSGDYMQSLTEYATQFSSGGASAEQFFSILKSGYQDGYLGADKAADSFKEFRIRIQDGSTATVDALYQIGINGEEMARQMANGSMTAVDAFGIVVEKLGQTKDSSVQMQAGAALLGTQFEDMGTQAALALDLTAVKAQDAAGASDRLHKSNETLEQSWIQLTKVLKLVRAKFGEVFSSGAVEAVEYMRETVDGLLQKVKQLKKDGTLDVWAANIKAVVAQTIEAVKSFGAITKSIFDGIPVSAQGVITAISWIAAEAEKLPLYFQGAFAQIDLVYSQMIEGAQRVSEAWYAVSGQFDKAFESKKHIEAEAQRQKAILETIKTIDKEKMAIEERKILVLNASHQAIETKKKEVAEHKKAEAEKTTASEESAKDQTAAADKTAKKQIQNYKEITAAHKLESKTFKAEYAQKIAEIERLEKSGVITHAEAQQQKQEAEKAFLEFKISQTSAAVDAAISEFGRESAEHQNAKTAQMEAERELYEFVTASMNGMAEASDKFIKKQTDDLEKYKAEVESATSSASQSSSSRSSSSPSSSGGSGGSGSSGGRGVLSMDQAMDKTVNELRANKTMESAAEMLGVFSKYSQMLKTVKELGGNSMAAKGMTLNQIEKYITSLMSGGGSSSGGSSGSNKNMGTMNINLPTGSGSVSGDADFLKQMQGFFNDYTRQQ